MREFTAGCCRSIRSTTPDCFKVTFNAIRCMSATTFAAIVAEAEAVLMLAVFLQLKTENLPAGDAKAKRIALAFLKPLVTTKCDRFLDVTRITSRGYAT